MTKRYAPPSDKNKTAKYLKFILSKLDIKDPKTMIRDLSIKQINALVNAIEQFEGWTEGKTETQSKPLQITKIMKDKSRTIVAYYVEKLGWLLKVSAIDLAKKQKIDAVVATSRSGNPYLRTRPDLKVENNLKLLG